MTEKSRLQIEKDMQLNFEEFRQRLGRFVHVSAWEEYEPGFFALNMVDGGGRVYISLKELPSRKITKAMPALPRTLVRIDAEKEVFSTFLVLFDRHFQKGGG